MFHNDEEEFIKDSMMRRQQNDCRRLTMPGGSTRQGDLVIVMLCACRGLFRGFSVAWRHLFVPMPQLHHK
jgi:hypothetical protein